MKQPIAVPDDLTGLDTEALTELAESIREQGEALKPDAATDDAALNEILRLVGDFDKVNAEIAAREAKAAERASRAAEALNKFHGGEPAVDETPAGEPVGEVAPEAEPAAASTEAPAPAAEAAPTEAAASTEIATGATGTPAVAATTVEAPAPAPTVQEDNVTTSSTGTSVAAVAAETPAAFGTRTEVEVAPGAPMYATNGVPGVSEGTALSHADMARAITAKRHGFGSSSAGAYERIVMGTAATELTYKVGGSEEANFSVLDKVRKDHAAREKQDIGLVAAGGVCAPLPPSYEFFRLAEEMNPVEASLPVAEAPRGGIRFISPPDFRDASGGVRVTTEAEDAAGYPPTAPKPCVRVTCPPVEECRVDAVSQCVTFGNLNYRVFPEQVEAFLADLAVIFTQVKEVFYLDAIDAASTNVTFSPFYSATRGLTYTLLAAAANYRRRHHMAIEAPLALYLPSWVVEFVKVDLINDHSMGLGFIGAGLAEVNQVFASMNLDVTWYYDSATGAGQAFDGAQGEGPLNQFPSNVVAYLFAPGTFVRLNAGTLDVGLVRDSVLNSTNDLQLFSEEWIQVCQPGLESLRLEISLCPDGTAPEPVLPLLCGASA